MADTAYERVKAARMNSRPTGKDYINAMVKGFIELHGDRRFGDDAAVVGGVGYLDGRAVTVIAIEKGHGAKDRLSRNFGAPNPEGYRKALRLMKQAEKFSRPVICFVDTSGAYCGIEAEERGQGQAIAENLMEMMTLKVPVLSILVGEGGSGGALALSVADEVWMLENSIYSVISPEGCASILWKDAAKAADAAESLKLTAKDALNMSIIERVVPERDLGRESFYSNLRFDIGCKLDELEKLSTEELTERRYRRFRALGTEQLAGE
jgi:acetyl-CoA carboxylase carboxyl transferase subunit alpha